jgi:ribosomal protein S18 acetylase RimI-like enzyme
MIFVVYDGNYKPKKPFDKLVNIVYENFIHLKKYPELNHNIKTIRETVANKDKIIILCFDNHYKRILGYLIGYNIVLNDGRFVTFISYIYVSTQLRSKGIGSKILNICFKESEMRGCEGIMLTCNTQDKHIMKFYEEKGFMLDFNLRRYTKYDILFKTT